MTGLPSREWELGTRDWTRGHGIPIDPALIPPDDDIQDVAAWLAGRFDTLHTAIQTFDLDTNLPDTQPLGGVGEHRRNDT